MVGGLESVELQRGVSEWQLGSMQTPSSRQPQMTLPMTPVGVGLTEES